MDWLDFGFSIVFSAIKGAVKNEGKKEGLRSRMVKLSALINSIWNDDEFKSDVTEKMKKL